MIIKIGEPIFQPIEGEVQSQALAGEKVMKSGGLMGILPDWRATVPSQSL